MRLRQRARDGQAEADALGPVQAGGTAAVVALEDLRQLVGTDADALVGHFQQQHAGLGRVHPHVHAATAMRVADGVVEQHHQQLAQALRVSQHGPGRRQRLGIGAQQLHAPLGGQRRGLGQRIGQRLGQVERPARQRQRIDVAARHRQQVVDDASQALRALDDALQRGAVLVGRAVAPAQGDLGLAPDGRGGRAQLVADVGKQLTAARVGLAQRLERALQLGGARHHLRFELLARTGLARLVFGQRRGHGVHAARHRGELGVALGWHAVVEPAFFERARAVAQLLQRLAQRPRKVQRSQQRRDRQRGSHGQPQAPRQGHRAVGGRAFAGHGRRLARDGVAKQHAQIAALRLVEHGRQGQPGLAGIGARCQRAGVGDGPLQRAQVALQHRQRVEPPQLFGAAVGAVVQCLRRIGQLLQPAQALAQRGLQGIADGGVGAGALLQLGHPRAQLLLRGREIDEAQLDVAGQAPALDLPMRLVEHPHGTQALQHHGGGQGDQRKRQAAAQHGEAIVDRPPRRRRPFIGRSSGVQAAFKGLACNASCRRNTAPSSTLTTLRNPSMKTPHLLAIAAALALSSSLASAQTVVNQAITEAEVLAAQRAWCQALVDISTTGERSGQAAAKALAERVIDSAYGYQMGAVLFKPTLTVAPQTFRTTRAGALAYFVGGDTNFPKDKGFALNGWTKCESRNAAVFIAGDSATSMGNVMITGKDGKVTTVDKTWGYVKDDAGKLRIVLHHSSLPFTN